MDPSAFGFLFLGSSTRENVYRDGVGVVSISGPLEHRRSYCWDSYESIRERFHDAATSEECTAIVLRIDSPGGNVAGLYQCVKALRNEKKKCGKPVTVYVDEACYSAAYALATVGDEIVLPSSGGVGSIGVISVLCDRTEHMKSEGLNVVVLASGARKTDGHPDVPLTEEVIERKQGDIDALAGQFFELVAASRPLSAKKVAALQAGTFLGEAAIEAGLADRVGSFGSVLKAAKDAALDSGTASGIRVDSSYQKVDNGRHTMTLAQMLAAFRAKLKAAKTEKDKRAIRDAISSISTAIAEIKSATTPAQKRKAAANAKKVEATYAKKMADDEDAEDDAEDDDAEDAEDDDAEDESGDDEDGDEDAEDEDDDDSDEDDDEDEDEEDAEDDDARRAASPFPSKGKKGSRPGPRGKGKSTRPGPRGSAAETQLVAMVQKLTGKRNLAEAMGAVQAMAAGREGTAKLAADMAKLKANAKREKVKGMVDKAIRDGKMLPAQRAYWMGVGTAKNGVAQLRGYIETAATIAHEYDHDAADGSMGPSGPAGGMPNGVTSAEVPIMNKLGVDPEAFAKQKVANAQALARRQNGVN